MTDRNDHLATSIARYPTPHGTFRVEASSGSTIIVRLEAPPGFKVVPREPPRPGMSPEALRSLAARPLPEPIVALSPMEYRVVRGEGGGLNVELKGRRPHVSHHPAYACMADFATMYAREHVEAMEAIRIRGRAASIEELEATAESMPAPESDSDVIRWRGLVDEGIADLPEPWRESMRSHGRSYEALLDAPAPLGPLVRIGMPTDRTEHSVIALVNQIRAIEGYLASRTEEKARLLRVAAKLRIRAEREACPSSDDLGHSAVFRSGGSGPSGVRG